MEVVVNTPRSFEAWRDTVQQMVDRGAAGTDAQFDEIIDYLHANLSTINVNTADADDLGVVLNVPDSVAEAIVARRTVRKFTSLEELKAITGLDPRVLDAKARMIFF
jgi:competence protein ComEA